VGGSLGGYIKLQKGLNLSKESNKQDRGLN
jgi:hypothetical protein